VALDDRAELLHGGQVGGQQLLAEQAGAAVRLVDDRREQVLLGVDVVVDAALEQSGGLRDVGDAGRRVALRPEQLGGRA
jgi:hypothetical protein